MHKLGLDLTPVPISELVRLHTEGISIGEKFPHLGNLQIVYRSRTSPAPLPSQTYMVEVPTAITDRNKTALVSEETGYMIVAEDSSVIFLSEGDSGKS